MIRRFDERECEAFSDSRNGTDDLSLRSQRQNRPIFDRLESKIFPAALTQNREQRPRFGYPIGLLLEPKGSRHTPDWKSDTFDGRSRLR
jgi:hypothetical protein